MSRIIRVAWVVVGWMVLGFLGGLVVQSPLLTVISEGAFTRWRSLGSPEERMSGFLGIGQHGPDHVIYGETEAGNVYRCCPQGAGQWERVERPEYAWDHACLPLPPRASPPPRPVRDCVEIGAYEWGTFRTQFALLDDGTVWMWHLETSVADYFNVICGSSLLGGVVGLVFGWRKERSKRHHSS